MWLVPNPSPLGTLHKPATCCYLSPPTSLRVPAAFGIEQGSELGTLSSYHSLTPRILTMERAELPRAVELCLQSLEPHIC